MWDLKVNSLLVYDGSKTNCGTCTLDSLHGVDNLIQLVSYKIYYCLHWQCVQLCIWIKHWSHFPANCILDYAIALVWFGSTVGDFDGTKLYLKKYKKHAIAFSHCKRCYSKCDHRLCIWINKTYILSFKMYRVNVGVVNSDPQFVIASALHRIKYAFLGRGISPVVYCITTINYVLESGGGETYTVLTRPSNEPWLPGYRACIYACIAIPQKAQRAWLKYHVFLWYIINGDIMYYVPTVPTQVLPCTM